MRRKKIIVRRLRLESLENRWVFALGHDCFLGQFDVDDAPKTLGAEGESAETSQAEDTIGHRHGGRELNVRAHDLAIRAHFGDNGLGHGEGEPSLEVATRLDRPFNENNSGTARSHSSNTTAVNLSINASASSNTAIDSLTRNGQTKAVPQLEVAFQPSVRPVDIQIAIKTTNAGAPALVNSSSTTGNAFANRLPAPGNPVAQHLATQAATIQVSTQPLRFELESRASSNSTDFKFYRIESTQRETVDLGSTAMATSKNRDSALQELESLLSDIAKEHWRNRSSEPRKNDLVDVPAAPTVSFSDVDPAISEGGMIALSIDRSNVITTILPDSDVDVDERKAWASNIGVYRAFEAGAVASVETKVGQRQDNPEESEDSTGQRMNPILASGSAFIGLIYFSLRRFRKPNTPRSERENS